MPYSITVTAEVARLRQGGEGTRRVFNRSGEMVTLSRHPTVIDADEMTDEIVSDPHLIIEPVFDSSPDPSSGSSKTAETVESSSAVEDASATDPAEGEPGEVVPPSAAGYELEKARSESVTLGDGAVDVAEGEAGELVIVDGDGTLDATPIIDLESLTVTQLRAMCADAGLTVRGTKAELVDRLASQDLEPIADPNAMKADRVQES